MGILCPDGRTLVLYYGKSVALRTRYEVEADGVLLDKPVAVFKNRVYAAADWWSDAADCWSDWSSGDEEDPEDTAAGAAMSRGGKTCGGKNLTQAGRSRGGKTTGARNLTQAGRSLGGKNQSRKDKQRAGIASGIAKRAKAAAAKAAAAKEAAEAAEAETEAETEALK